MVTGTRARSDEEMVDALAEGLPMLRDTCRGSRPRTGSGREPAVNSGHERVFSGQPQPQVNGHIGS